MNTTRLQIGAAFRERFGSPEPAGIESVAGTTATLSSDAGDQLIAREFSRLYPSKATVIPRGESGRLLRAVQKRMIAQAVTVSTSEGSTVQQPGRSGNPLMNAIRRRHPELHGS